jgi:hypothetical protein
MSPPPTNIDGTDITGATIDGTEVQSITIDGQEVFSADAHPGGKLAHYAIDTTSDTSFSDITGNRPDASLQAGTNSIADARFFQGFVLDFPGGDTAFLNTSTGPFTGITLAATIDHQVSQTGSTIIMLGDGGNTGVLLGIDKSNSNRFGFETLGVNNPTTIRTQSDITLGVEHRLVARINSDGSGDFFDNATQQAMESGNIASAFQRFSHTIGGLGGNNSQFEYDGLIDNCIIYDRVLTASEIQQDFDAQPWS